MQREVAAEVVVPGEVDELDTVHCGRRTECRLVCHEVRVGRPQALRQARPWFARLGLDGLERRRSGELSGGQAQRAALARGLVTSPKVLFADEPTGSLDSLTGEHVMDQMVGAAREHGTTVVLVTHEARVAAYADRHVMVRDGKVAALAPDRVLS